jgi:hypothetical protein
LPIIREQLSQMLVGVIAILLAGGSDVAFAGEGFSIIYG